MRTLRITFLWDDLGDEEEVNSYDQMYENLMYLGAYNVDEEEVKEPKSKSSFPKQKKQ